MPGVFYWYYLSAAYAAFIQEKEMDQAQLLSLIGSLYDKLVTDVALRVTQIITQSDAFKEEIDRLLSKHYLISQSEAVKTENDRKLITVWIKEELEDVLGDLDDRIGEYLSDNFDINDHADSLDIDDKISDYMANNLRDEVRDQVRNMDFTVTVE